MLRKLSYWYTRKSTRISENYLISRKSQLRDLDKINIGIFSEHTVKLSCAMSFICLRNNYAGAFLPTKISISA